MKRDFVFVDPTPQQEDLCREFAAWCTRHGIVPPADDNPMLLNLLNREQRQWLSNFIARWDWSTEARAREIGALVTPLELAGVYVAVAREACAGHEWAQVRAGMADVSDFLEPTSVMDLAFARAHRLPVGARGTPEREAAAARLKQHAQAIVSRELAGLATPR